MIASTCPPEREPRRGNHRPIRRLARPGRRSSPPGNLHGFIRPAGQARHDPRRRLDAIDRIDRHHLGPRATKLNRSPQDLGLSDRDRPAPPMDLGPGPRPGHDLRSNPGGVAQRDGNTGSLRLHGGILLGPLSLGEGSGVSALRLAATREWAMVSRLVGPAVPAAVWFVSDGRAAGPTLLGSRLCVLACSGSVGRRSRSRDRPAARSAAACWSSWVSRPATRRPMLGHWPRRSLACGSSRTTKGR